MRGYLSFLFLWIKKAFTQSLGAVETLSGLIAAGISAFNQYSQKGTISMEDWEILLWAFGAVVAVRILIAPYLLWKEEKEKSEVFRNSNNALQIGFYSKQVSFLYDDLIKNWSNDGISGEPLTGTPRSFKAYKYLEEIAPAMLLKEQVRDDLRAFLNYFIINRSILAATFPQIRTVFENKKDLGKKSKDIKILAEKLAKDLTNVAKPKQEE